MLRREKPQTISNKHLEGNFMKTAAAKSERIWHLPSHGSSRLHYKTESSLIKCSLMSLMCCRQDLSVADHLLKMTSSLQLRLDIFSHPRASPSKVPSPRRRECQSHHDSAGESDHRDPHIAT